MKTNEHRKKISRTLKFTEYWSDSGEYLGGGISNSMRGVNKELWVQIFDDLVMDQNSDELGSTGRQQIHIGGTREAFEKLGTFFLALSKYEPPKPGYNFHIDLTNETGEPTIHFVLQLPINDIKEKCDFEKTINIGTAIISEDGRIREITTLPIKEKKNSDKV